MDKKWCVYVHTSPSGKRYVGITSQKPEDRWRNGRGYLKRNDVGKYWQPAMAHAILKYPNWNEWQHEIVASGISESEAKNFEKILIDKLNSNVNCGGGYNITEGGGGHVGCDNRGEKNPMYGRKHSDSTRALISEKTKGRKAPNKSVPHSEETKKKMKENHNHISGKQHWRYGKSPSQLAIDKSIEVNSVAVCQYDLQMNFIAEYKSAREAERKTGIDSRNICAVCKYRAHTAGGYIWLYKNDSYDIDIQKELEKRKKDMKLNKFIVQYDMDMNIINNFISLREAERVTGFRRQSISNACKSDNHEYNNYLWFFKETD